MARCIPYVPRRVRDPVAVAMALAAPEPAAAADKVRSFRRATRLFGLDFLVCAAAAVPDFSRCPLDFGIGIRIESIWE